MPYKKRWKKKRTYRRKNRSKKRRSLPIIKCGDSIMPSNRLYSLRYCETVSLNPGLAGVTATHLFLANHIHDPNSSGGGHQPLGHDELAAFFNHYCVVGSKLTVKFQSITSDNYECGAFISEDATLITDRTHIREYQKGTQCYLTSGSKQLGSASAKYSARKFFGMKSVTSSDKLWGTFGASPAGTDMDLAYYQVWAGGAGDTDEAPVYAHVTIDYIVKPKEPKVLGQS